MNLQIDENADIRTVQTLIDEAKSLGMRVVHKPDTKTNIVSIDSFRPKMRNNHKNVN